MGFVEREREQGFMLVGLIVAIFLILLALSVAAPRVAHELRREREVETVRRGNQYVRAIQLYYRKFGHYPGSMEQLEKTNNIRFLRQQYVDPMTGKADWRLIKVGEAKTTVKGFFGKPLTGLTPGLGSAAGMASSGGIGAGAAGSSGAGSPLGSSSPGSPAGGLGASPVGSPMGGPSGPGSPGAASPGLGSSGPGASPGTVGSSGFGAGSGMGSQSATSFTGGGAPFMGVGLVKDGDSILILNEQTSYPTWEFIYDPRIEQLKAKGGLLGGAAGSTDATGLGSGSGSGSGFGTGFGTSGPGTSPSPNTPASPGGSTGTPAPRQ